MARILLIDDDPAIRNLASGLLRARGHTVDCPGESLPAQCSADLVLCHARHPLAPGLAARVDATALLLAAPADAALRERLLDAGFAGYVGLPLDPDSFADEVEAFLAPAQGALLLVDDDPFMLGVLEDLVQGQGWRVLTAGSASEALALLAREPVAVLVSDQRMPGLSGAQLLAEVRTRYPRVARFLLSGQSDDPAILAALREGVAEQFFPKPWNGETLLAALHAAFRLEARGGVAGARF